MQNIHSEIEFENHLRNNIMLPLLSSHLEFQLYDFKKAVDILVAKNGINPQLYFIEVKYHKRRHGRLGFGQGQGAGFQPEVLRNRTDYFENNLIWILGHEEREGYWLVNNETLRNYLNGGGVGEKYNGIQMKLFREIQPLTSEEIIDNLSNWLGISNNP